jgi:hypothetical protein
MWDPFAKSGFHVSRRRTFPTGTGKAKLGHAFANTKDEMATYDDKPVLKQVDFTTHLILMESDWSRLIRRRYRIHAGTAFLFASALSQSGCDR